MGVHSAQDIYVTCAYSTSMHASNPIYSISLLIVYRIIYTVSVIDPVTLLLEFLIEGEVLCVNWIY